MRSLLRLAVLPLLLVATPANARTDTRPRPRGGAHKNSAATPRGAKTPRPAPRQRRASHHEERERSVAPYTHDGGPNILAEAAVVVDLKTGEELYARRPDDVRPIASIS